MHPWDPYKPHAKILAGEKGFEASNFVANLIKILEEKNLLGANKPPGVFLVKGRYYVKDPGKFLGWGRENVEPSKTKKAKQIHPRWDLGDFLSKAKGKYLASSFAKRFGKDVGLLMLDHRSILPKSHQYKEYEKRYGFTKIDRWWAISMPKFTQYLIDKGHLDYYTEVLGFELPK